MEEPQSISVHTYFEEYIGFFFRFHVGKAAAMLLFLGWILYGKFISKGDWYTIQYLLHEVAVTNGSVGGSEGTGIEIDGQEVIRFFFSYEVGGELHFGDAYATGNPIVQGSAVEVTYLVKNPYLSRIPGTRNATYSPWVFLWLLVPLAGLIFGIFGIIKVYRMGQLLHGGRLTTAHRVKTGVVDKSSFSPMVKVSYHFEHGNSSSVHHKWTSKPLNFREKELLVYVDKPPYHAMLCKDFPKSIVASLENTHSVSLK